MSTLGKVVLGALGAISLLATPGCISLLPESEPVSLYRLTGLTADEVAPSAQAQTILIDHISAPRGLAVDRVALLRDGELAYMAGAAWLSPAPTLLHDRILDVFLSETPELIPARSEDGVQARYRLQLELRRFEAEYDQGDAQAPLIQMRMVARLIDRDERALAASRRFDISVRASDNRQAALIDAFSQASNETAHALADWAASIVCAETAC
jgi:cholesterol transport system auxiliary component